jgi:hypothetical protein
MMATQKEQLAALEARIDTLEKAAPTLTTPAVPEHVLEQIAKLVADTVQTALSEAAKDILQQIEALRADLIKVQGMVDLHEQQFLQDANGPAALDDVLEDVVAGPDPDEPTP